MFSSILSLLVLCPIVWAGNAINDLNCTNGATAGYTENAFPCSNVQADSACELLYVKTADYKMTPGDIEDRPPQCYSDLAYAAGNPVVQGIKDMAVATCPKQCGYCCETKEYKCANIRFPRINCASITTRMCRDPSWRDIIAKDCPSACGFCLLGGCIDSAPDCATQPSICVTRGLESFVASNCQRTCDQCSTVSTTASSSTCNVATLTDANANCASWVKNGFCTNTFYTAAQRKSYCARSCGLC